MLNKLVISKEGAKDTKLRALLVSTSILVTAALTMGLIFSLFSQNLAMGSDDLNISTLVAPPVIPDVEPPKQEPIKRTIKKLVPDMKPKMAIRKQNILRLDESPKTPKTISTSPISSKARPKNLSFKIGTTDSEGVPAVKTKRNGCTSNCGDKAIKIETSDNDDTKTNAKKIVKPPKPPVVRKKPKKPIIISDGVVNSKAKRLVTPAYPAAARAVRAGGKVTVQVLISESGRVISANVIKGHPMLRRAAVRAARASTFTPTTLSAVPVRVRGMIIYNFKK